MEKERWNYIKQGNIAVYSETYVFYYKKLYNYGRKLTENTTLIEDAIQSIFVMLWKDREKLETIYSPHSYIFYSFRNYIFKEKSKLQKTPFQEEEEEFNIESIIINKESTNELNKRLQEALSRLTPRQREAVFLRFYEGLSFEEVARILNISVKATYKLISRSLTRLKELMRLSTILILALLKQM